MVSRKWVLFIIFALFLAFGCSYRVPKTSSQPGGEKQYKSYKSYGETDPFKRRRSDFGR